MRFVTGQDRNQSTLFPELLDDYVGDDNPVRAIDVFVDELRLGDLGFEGVQPHATGRPALSQSQRQRTPVRRVREAPSTPQERHRPSE